jgi:hypothetical protein
LGRTESTPMLSGMRSALPAVVPLLLATTVHAGRKVEVPVDVGIGPAAYLISGPVFADQPVHFGLKINVEAVIDKEWIRRNERAIPSRFRGMARNVNEVRISPSIFIPDALFISPKLRNTGIFGITWRPLSVGQPFGSGPVKLRLGAGLLATYFFLYSDVLPTTHFLRPGVDLMAELELGLSKSFLVSLGWASGFYIPQGLGSFGIGPISSSIWHVGQAFLQLHFRFPVAMEL